MFSYRLHYVDLSYQNRRIITLDRIDEINKIAVRIRASEEQQSYSYHNKHYIDYIITDIEKIKHTTDKECYYSEDLLGSNKSDSQTYKTYSDVFNLIVKTYPGWPEIVRTTFVGDIANKIYNELSGLCSTLTITNLRPEQKEIIDRIFDDAATIYQNKTTMKNNSIYMTFLERPEDASKAVAWIEDNLAYNPKRQDDKKSKAERDNPEIYDTIPESKTIKVEEDVICCICMDTKPNAYWSPCGHNDFCFDCIKTLTTCPKCRTKGCAELQVAN